MKPYLFRLLERDGTGKEEEIEGTLHGVIVAALDTTAHSLGFLLANLGANPEVQEKLFQELNSVCKVTPETKFVVDEQVNKSGYFFLGQPNH